METFEQMMPDYGQTMRSWAYCSACVFDARLAPTLVDMTWRRAMLQNLFPGSVAEESGSS